MRRKRKQNNPLTPTTETLIVPPSSNAVTGTTQPMQDTHAAESSVEPKVRSAQEPSQSPRSGRKRRRRRKKNTAPTNEAAQSAPQAPVEAAPRPKVIWPDPKPPNWIATADNRLAYTPEFVTEPAQKPIPKSPPKSFSREKAAPGSTVIKEYSTPASEDGTVKVCLYCGETKPLGDFLRRTGKKSGNESRRGACRDCRKRRRAARLSDDGVTSDPLPLPLAAGPARSLDLEEDALETAPKRRFRRPPPEPPEDALLEPTREAELRTTKQGTIRMRGRTDKGRRWQQETDLEMARCLVREHAAVVVNRFTIRRLYTNRSFRRYILERDRYTCHFCGEYGDTIDHLLPRAKGGHTTPLNCVCACMLCNQNKADRDLDEFMEDAEPLDDRPLDSGFERRPIEH